MNYHLKGLKTFNGMEGGGYEATLYLDKKKVAIAMNGGAGGCDDFHFVSRDDESAFQAFVDAWYETSRAKVDWAAFVKEHGLNDDEVSAGSKMESWVSSAIGDIENQKRLKRLARTQTLFRLKGDNEGDWRTVKPAGDRAVLWIREKYGDKVETIFGAIHAVTGPATTAPSEFNF